MPPTTSSRPPAPRARHRRRAGQAGMTLVEMMVAMLIAAIVFAAGAAALIAATKGLDFARQNRQAADVFTEAVERVRAADYDDVAVVPDAAALAADTRLTHSGGEHYLDPDGAGPAPAERLVTSPTGAVTLRAQSVRENTPYLVSSYVTEPDADAGYRRLVTWVTWERGTRTLSRQAATVIAPEVVAAEQPAVSVGTDASFSVNAGATLHLPLTVVNEGPAPRWNLTTSVPGRSWTVAWYVDANGNGVRDGGEDTALVDTSGDGTVDTGALAAAQTVKLVGVVTVPAGDAAGTATATITASAASAPQVSGTVTHTITVVTQSCVGCTYRTVWAANTTGAAANSTLQARMALVDAVGGAVSLPNYDTDQDTTPGRTMVAGAATVTVNDATRVAIWGRALGSAIALRGDAVVRMYVGVKALNASGTATLRAELGHVNASGNSWTSVGGLTTGAIPLTSSLALVEMRIPVTQVTVANNRTLQMRIAAPSASGSLALGYGTAQYPARVDLPVVS